MFKLYLKCKRSEYIYTFLNHKLSYFLIICFQLINIQQMTVLKINMEIREASLTWDSFQCGFKFCDHSPHSAYARHCIFSVRIRHPSCQSQSEISVVFTCGHKKKTREKFGLSILISFPFDKLIFAYHFNKPQENGHECISIYNTYLQQGDIS